MRLLIIYITIGSSFISSVVTRAIEIVDNNNNNKHHHYHRSLIVGGHDATSGTYPGMVWSGVHTDDDNSSGGSSSWGCGGAMIHPDIFVTAAHCQPVFEEQGGAYVGATQQNGSDGTYRRIRKLIPHPKHHHPDNDIMIVVLQPQKKKIDNAAGSSFFEMNRNPNFPFVGSNITSIGFGLTTEPSDESSADDGDITNNNDEEEQQQQPAAQLATTLQEVTVNVWDFPSCQTTFQQGQGITLTESLVLCMGTVDGGRDACDSDSGSPLLAATTTDDSDDDNNSSSMILVGLINDGIGCGRPNTPAYNVRISSYVQWIDYHICQWSDEESLPSKCMEYNNQSNCPTGSTQNGGGGGVSYVAFIGSIIIAFVVGSITSWIVIVQGTTKKWTKRSRYDRLLAQPDNDGDMSITTRKFYGGNSKSNNCYDDEDEDEEMTAEMSSAEPSPALSSISRKFSFK